jgi:hypothetical protein
MQLRPRRYALVVEVRLVVRSGTPWAGPNGRRTGAGWPTPTTPPGCA